MFLKDDWTTHLHGIRQREVEMVFDCLGKRHFRSGLEVGAGDGYQTGLLAYYCDTFISSDLNFKRIKDELKVPGVKYQQFDADALGGVFMSKQFDFIFSSNVLEHVGKPKAFLQTTHEFLSEDGIAVHIVPSRFLKITYVTLHYLNVGLLVVDRIGGLFQGKKIFRGKNIDVENNINPVVKKRAAKIMRFLIPSIHGNFKNHTEEFIKFGRKRWELLFTECGYGVVMYRKGPAFSGYGFGFHRLRPFFEKMGWSSEHIFILEKTKK